MPFRRTPLCPLRNLPNSRIPTGSPTSCPAPLSGPPPSNRHCSIRFLLFSPGFCPPEWGKISSLPLTDTSHLSARVENLLSFLFLFIPFQRFPFALGLTFPSRLHPPPENQSLQNPFFIPVPAYPLVWGLSIPFFSAFCKPSSCLLAEPSLIALRT